jgi:protein CpxP
MSLKRTYIIAGLMLVAGGIIAVIPPHLDLPNNQAIAQNSAGQNRAQGMSPGSGNGPGNGMMQGQGQGKDQWLMELNLSPEQMQKLQEIRNQNQDKMDQQKQQVQAAYQELRAVMASDASADQVREKYRQVKTLKQQMSDTHFENMLAMREVLNLEQRKQFAEHMKNHRQRFQNRMGNDR